MFGYVSERPPKPDVNYGCHECGGGKDRPLNSITFGSVSIALCDECVTRDPKTLNQVNYNARHNNG